MGSVQAEPSDVTTSTFHERSKIFVSNGNAVHTVLAKRIFSNGVSKTEKTAAKDFCRLFVHRTSVPSTKVYTGALIVQGCRTNSSKRSVALR